MIRFSQRASQRGSRARVGPHRPARRSRRATWAGLLAVSALSLGGILFSHNSADQAAAQTPAQAGAKKGGTPVQKLGAIPGAGTKLDAAALAQIIDQEVSRRLASEDIKASPLADDAEFLRRVYLDLVGIIPPVEKVSAFLDSKDANKRGKLVEELLTDPRYGKWLAENWVVAMVPRDSNNRLLQRAPLQEWLTKHFNANTAWDKLVYDVLTASGEQDKNGAITYFVGNNTVDKITDSVTKLFMGVQLQCAQCHNHPFTSWKQDEYWGMAQFFMKVRLSANPQQAAKKGIPLAITEEPKGKAKKKGLPESAKFVPARFLQAAENTRLVPSEPARPVLAKWMTSPKNPFFARAMVNRTWAHLFGRGLVNPVDDMHDGNPATHPELLAALTEQFTRNNFDLKYLIRAIVNSQTYQRTSRPTAGNDIETELLSHAAVRMMTAEQLYDSLTGVVGAPGRGAVDFGKKGAGKKGPGGPREQFITFFRLDEGADVMEYQAGIPQALRLMNSALLNNTNQFVTRAMSQGGKSPAQVVQYLYMATLSRRPTPQELERRVGYVTRQSDPRTAYADLTWALLNSSEFAMNH